MALINNYHISQFDLNIPNCYWKIEVDNGISGGKGKIRVRLNCYKNKENADIDKEKYGDYDFDFIPDLTSNINFIAQAYNYAKTLPFFENAIDA